MDVATWLIYFVFAFIALWFILMPIAIITNLLYGLGVDHPLVRPFWRISRGVSLGVAIVGLVLYVLIIESIFRVPILTYALDRIIGGANG